MEKDLIFKKADLILGGGVKLPEEIFLPVKFSKSSAGPEAGKTSLIFEFSNFRVKKSVSYDEGEFSLVLKEKGYSLYKNGILFIDDVKISSADFHAPEQAFFNISQNCIFRCAFCSSPLLKNDFTQNLTPEKVSEIIEKPIKNGEVKSVSFTGSVQGSVQESVDNFVRFIGKTRENYPEITIGVELYVETEEQILQLKNAGADEIKINIECATAEILENVCPGKDYDNILRMLEHSVKVFGKGKVCSNLIFGLGESDDDIFNVLANAASKGIMINLRALRSSIITENSINDALGNIGKNTPERMILLSEYQKKIFSKYDLNPNTMKTMCFPCRCCDIIPFADL